MIGRYDKYRTFSAIGTLIFLIVFWTVFCLAVQEMFFK